MDFESDLKRYNSDLGFSARSLEVRFRQKVITPPRARAELLCIRDQKLIRKYSRFKLARHGMVPIIPYPYEFPD